MRKFFCLLFLLTLTVNAFSDNNIPLVKDEPPSERSKERERDASGIVTASIDGVTIALDLSFLAECEYCVTDSSTDAVICSGRFRAGAITVFNMPAGTPAGTYRLSVYAYGCWWTGTFEL